jgi:hypothetical protein
MKKQNEPRRFESVTLGLPPLKMILSQPETVRRKRPIRKTAISQKSQKELERLRAVIKLIDHFTDLH